MREIVEELLKGDCRRDGYGVSCNFYNLGSSEGVKVYNSYKDAFRHFASQLLLHLIGHAPRCWSLTELSDGRWYYWTEVVTTWTDADIATMRKHRELESEIWQDAISFASQIQQSHRWIHIFDMHPGNIGWTGVRAYVIDAGGIYYRDSEGGMICVGSYPELD